MVTAAKRRRQTAPLHSMTLAQIRATLIFYRRSPSVLVFSLLLPIMFYTFFGSIYGNQRVPKTNTTLYAYLLASYGAYAVSSIMVFNIGIGISQQRARKADLLQRATPLPAWVAILAQVVGALVVGTVSLLPLFAEAALVGHVRLQPQAWLELLVVLLLGSLPLLGLGLTIGYAAGANSAPAIANLIYLPMSFLSGLLIPLSAMPEWVQKVGSWLPTYHYGQLAWRVVGAGQEEPWQSAVWLAGWGLILLGAAARAYRLDSLRKFS